MVAGDTLGRWLACLVCLRWVRNAGAFPPLHAGIREAGQHMAGRFIPEDYCPQGAADALHLLYVANTDLLLPMRGTRQATEAHYIAFAQVP